MCPRRVISTIIHNAADHCLFLFMQYNLALQRDVTCPPLVTLPFSALLQLQPRIFPITFLLMIINKHHPFAAAGSPPYYFI